MTEHPFAHELRYERDAEAQAEAAAAQAERRLNYAAPAMLVALRQCAAALRQCNHVAGVTEQAIWAADAAIHLATGDEE